MTDPIKIRTVFMGTSPFAEKILGGLLENNYNVISVYTKQDKKTGRGQEIKKSSVKILAEKNNLPVFQPEKFNEEALENLQKQKPDILIVTAYGKILPKEILGVPGFGCLNIHPSLLPKFRGPSPIQNALLEGEEETGTTIMLMDEEIDAGDILSEKKLPVGPDETYFELHTKLSGASVKLLLETIPLWVKRKVSPQKQDGERATYCQLIEKKDGQIVWSDSATSIYNRYRAFLAWPGIFTFWEKDGFNLRLKLTKISLEKHIPKSGRELGQVFEFGEKIAVQAEEGAIILEEIQLEGKAKNTISDFINGQPNFVGSVLK